MSVAQGFFTQLNGPTSEELLMNMDLHTTMKLIKFGEGLSRDAQQQAINEKLFGSELQANMIARDVTTIQTNLNSLYGAVKLAMN